MTSSLQWVNVHESAPGRDWSVDCSGQWPHSETVDLYRMSQLLSQTVSLIHFKRWKKTKTTRLFCAGLSCGRLSFNGIYTDSGRTADRVWKLYWITLSAQCCLRCTEQILSRGVLLWTNSFACSPWASEDFLLWLNSLYVSPHQNKLWTVSNQKSLQIPVFQVQESSSFALRRITNLDCLAVASCLFMLSWPITFAAILGNLLNTRGYWIDFLARPLPRMYAPQGKVCFKKKKNGAKNCCLALVLLK